MVSINKLNFNANNINFKSNKVNKETNNVKDNTSISIYKTKGLQLPYSQRAISFHIDMEEPENKQNEVLYSSFRDDELFDDERDTLSAGYYHYDDDDVIPEKQYKDPVNINYRLGNYDRLISEPPREYVISENAISYKNQIPNIVNNEDVEQFKQYLNDKYKSDNLRDVALNACLINKDDKRELSPLLMNCFMADNEIHSVRELSDIYNGSKLTQSNGDEVVDNSLLVIGYDALNRYPSNKNYKAKMILNYSKTTDKKGNEVFSPQKNAVVMKLINSGESFDDLPILMNTVTSNPTKASSRFDSDSLNFVHRLKRRGISLPVAADITNACKLKNSKGDYNLNSDLQNIAINGLLAKSYKPETVAPVINSLKVDNSDSSERISKPALDLMERLVSDCKTDKQLIKYTKFCNVRDEKGRKTFDFNRARAVINA